MANLKQTLQSQFFSSIGDANQFLRLFDFLPHVFLYLKDTQGRFTALNSPLVHSRRASHERELLGKTDLQIHPAFWGRKYQQENPKVIESGGGDIQNQVWLVPIGDGKLASFLSSKIPLGNHEGSIIGIAGVMYPLAQQLHETVSPDAVQVATEFINQH